MGYFYELQDDKKKTIATTQRLDETADGHPLDVSTLCAISCSEH